MKEERRGPDRSRSRAARFGISVRISVRPPRENRTRGVARSDRGENDKLSFLESAVIERFANRQRYRRGGRVTKLVNVLDHFVLVETEPVCRRVYDSQV